MCLAHPVISAVFSLVNQLLESQVRHSQSHIIMVHHLNAKYMSLGQIFHLVCTVLISISYKISLVVWILEHYTFLAMKIYVRGKELFSRLVSFIAICWQVQLFPMPYLES